MSHATKLSALAAAVALAFGASVHAASHLETFDGPLDTALWNLDDGGNDWQIGGGKLTITRNGNGTGFLAFLPRLIGNFNVQFDYAVTWQNTYAFGDRIQLSTYTDVPAHSYVVGHTQEGSVYAAAVDPSARYGWGSNTPMGTLRVARTGADLTMQYLSAGDWVTLQTGTDTRDMHVQLTNFIHNGFTAGSQVEIDNFSIVADQFAAPVPEPETWALLLAGLGLVGLMIRRRRD